MRQTKSLPAPRWSLVRRVLAGCRQSLLGDGPSRHYLCNPCVGAWTHTPPRLSSALAHSFLESTGLTPRKMRSAREIVPAMQRQQGAVFRGCSHSFIFRLLRSLGPQIASTAASSCWAAGPFTPRIARVVTHSGMWHRYVSAWAIDTAGLAPAGLQPCRLLPAASGSSTDSFATRRRVPAGPGSQAMATAIPTACLASSAIRCRDVETGPNLGVLAVFPSNGATCRCPLPSTGSRGLNSPASAVL